MFLRKNYPVKYSSDEGFVEHKIELGNEELKEILRECLGRHADLGRIQQTKSGENHCAKGVPSNLAEPYVPLLGSTQLSRAGAMPPRGVPASLANEYGGGRVTGESAPGETS